jgi:hypothetical protein
MTAMVDQQTDVAALKAEIERLRLVCAEAYQLAGEVGAPVRVLDNLSAAADGRPLPHETFLPVTLAECDPAPRL